MKLPLIYEDTTNGFLILKWAFFIGIMIIPKIPMKNRGCKMRNQFSNVQMHLKRPDISRKRCINKVPCILFL